jgi:23S rRNA pseudouridine1911/1915/1917 synthase
MTLLDWLAAHYPTAKRTTLRRMLRAARVTVDGQIVNNPKHQVLAASTVEVSDRPTTVPSKNTLKLPFQIVHEDADILVVNKPPGLLTSTVAGERRPTLRAAVWEYVRSREPRARVGVIHRLDRDACGLLIFSKNDEAYASLKRQFFQHTVRREYLAVVHGRPEPPSGRLETRLVERTDGTVHSTRQAGKGEIAITDYEVLGTVSRKQSILRVTLLTGRKHQIRAHLSECGTPIVGDKVYGPEKGGRYLLLAAVRLTIHHPRDWKEMDFTVPPPRYFPSASGAD